MSDVKVPDKLESLDSKSMMEMIENLLEEAEINKDCVFIKGNIDYHILKGYYEGYSKNKVACGKGTVYSDATKKKIITKGIFEKNRIVKGEWFVGEKWYVGTFVDGKLNGEGCVYSDYEKKILRSRGVYKNDKLINGELFANERWYIGTFPDGELDGEGCIYSDYEKKKLYSRGVYKNSKLIKGERYLEEKLYIGEFVDGQLTGEGCIYNLSNGEKKLSSKGIYEKNKLVKGEYLIVNYGWVVDGNVSSAKFEGDIEIYSDHTKTKLLRKGFFVGGRQTNGEIFRNGKWYVGKFTTESISNKTNFSKGIVYSDYEKTRIHSIGTYENWILVSGELYVYFDRTRAESEHSVESDSLIPNPDIIKEIVNKNPKLGMIIYSGNFINGMIRGIGYKYTPHTIWDEEKKTVKLIKHVKTQHVFVDGFEVSLVEE